MNGQLVEALIIAAAVVAIFYILWRNNEGRHGPGPGGDGQRHLHRGQSLRLAAAHHQEGRPQRRIPLAAVHFQGQERLPRARASVFHHLGAR